MGAQKACVLRRRARRRGFAAATGTVGLWADVRDYLELRGDVTLAERPFNDVDALALCVLSYLDLSGVVGAPGEEGVRVADACAELLVRTRDMMLSLVGELVSGTAAATRDAVARRISGR